MRFEKEKHFALGAKNQFKTAEQRLYDPKNNKNTNEIDQLR
jgi:hypothetical protein